MTGIVFSIDPVALRFGVVDLRWYNVVIIVTFTTRTVIAALEAKRRQLKSDYVYSLTPWMLITGLVGVRLFHVAHKSILLH